MSKKLNEAGLRDELSSSAFFKSDSNEPASELTSQSASQLTVAPAARPVRSLPSRRAAKRVSQTAARVVAGERARVVEEHAYDIYQDQARWLNRTQLEMEENHGAKVMKYEIVRVAIDLIRLDFEANGPDSQLTRVLLKGLPLSLPGLDAAEMEERG